jgi:hypothetical protein
MSSYTKATNFATKDTLPTGDANKIVKGTEIDNEFNAISGAISSKADIASPTFTGTPAAPTATTGSNTTQLANTAYVKQEITALGTIGTMAAQNKTAVDITGGTIVGITDLAVADGGTGASSITANSVVLGNGASALNGNLVAPGTNGNVLKSNGSTWISAAPASLSSSTGSLSNGSTFNITTGSSGVALITVEFLTLAQVGNFGGATGYLDIGGGNVASKYTQTIEYSNRNSGCGGTILYRYTGSANTTVTGTFSWSGSGSLHSASYMVIGI